MPTSSTSCRSGVLGCGLRPAATPPRSPMPGDLAARLESTSGPTTSGLEAWAAACTPGGAGDEADRPLGSVRRAARRPRRCRRWDRPAPPATGAGTAGAAVVRSLGLVLVVLVSGAAGRDTGRRGVRGHVLLLIAVTISRLGSRTGSSLPRSARTHGRPRSMRLHRAIRRRSPSSWSPCCSRWSSPSCSCPRRR